MGRHYNLSKKLMPGAILIDENQCFYSDYHTTVEHERELKQISAKWMMFVERTNTIVADTDGGCDRDIVKTYTHELKLDDAIFFEGQIVGFYLDFQTWNGHSDRPNSHIFMLDDETTHIHYNTHITWRLVKKEE